MLKKLKLSLECQGQGHSPVLTVEGSTQDIILGLLFLTFGTSKVLNVDSQDILDALSNMQKTDPEACKTLKDMLGEPK